MKNDYPNANARLAEVAKSWAEGEVSLMNGVKSVAVS